MLRLKQHTLATLLYPALLILSEQYSSLFESQPIIWPATAGLLVIALSFNVRMLIGPMISGFVILIADIAVSGTNLGFGMSPLQAILFSAGALIRTLFVLWLINRWIRPLADTLRTPLRLLVFMVLIGPVNGSLDTFVMLFFIDSSTYANDVLLTLYVRWWLAMTAGGLIFTPPLLLILSPELMSAYARRWYLWSSLFAIALLYAIVMFIHVQVYDELEQLNQRTSDRLAESLRDTFDEIVDLNNSMRSLLTVLPDVDEESFFSIAAELQGYDSPFVSFVSWSDWVPEDRRIAYENQFNCEINPIREEDTYSDPSDINVLIPVRYLYPASVTEQVRCRDLAAEPQRRRALFIAIQTGNPYLSDPIALAADQGPGLILFTPAYDDYADPVGVIASVIEIESLLQSSISDNNLQSSWLEIQQLNDQSETTIYEQSPNGLAGLAAFGRSLNLSFYGQSWRIHWRPMLSEFSRIFAWQITLVIAIASVAVLLIQFIAFRTGTLTEVIQEEVERKTNDLTNAQQAAEQATIAKSQFLANMSHEIRTPLNAIIGFAELAQDESNLMTIQSHLKGISSSSEALLGLVNDVLDYSKLEAGKLELHRAPFSLQELAKRLRSIFETQARARGLSFRIDVDCPANKDIVSDETRLQQILINLCSNAIKFTRHGDIHVQMQVLEEQETQLMLVVKDTGIGMTESERARIFDQFTQADSSITRHYGGTGLGLSITMTLTELLDGQVMVESEQGVGSQFTIRLPVSLQASEQAPAGHWRVNDNYRILVVDDNAVNLKVTRALLRKSGFQVDIASRGEDAIDSIRASVPDLVLMDIQMPGMDGLATTRLLRQDPDFRHLVIIGLTANVSKEDRQACLDAGMNDYLTKPISLLKLSECLSRWLPV
ncbi:hypothetical tryptophan-rich sensor protein [Reinekea sp. MED297]|uniref:histidine kinase n=2 Tax=Reinekea TaxID=230494 RepID=A4BFQ3_9GAMM|nr:hypothetical tryptophan-rich sensor protein [Reinekea sp. MED297] [Reinekea blandensis MED297]